MKSELVLITPKMAEDFLSKNTQNRNIGKSRVEGYANDILSGRWHLNPNPISFDIDGALADGQHRLHAIIRAGKAVEMMVMTGLPKESIQIIDFGKPRSAADILKIEGYPDANNLAALASRLIAFEAGNLSVLSVDKSGGGQRSARYNLSTKPEVVAFVRKHFERLHSINREAMNIYGNTNIVLMSPSEIGLLLEVLKPHESALLFISMVITGIGLNENTPELAIRRLIERVRMKRDFPITSTDFIKYFIVAFEKYKKGEKCQILRIKDQNGTK